MSNTEKTKNESIISGRMPIAAVYAARFYFNEIPTKDCAKLFGTTVGKIADIRKNSNFSYIDENTRFTADQKKAAMDWIKQHPNYDEAGADEVYVFIESLPEATETDIENLNAARIAARGQKSENNSEPKARRGRKAKTAEAIEATDEEIDAEQAVESDADEDLID